tara:strand:- start:663 stop:1358 length:696 start_codon:yes stop_codon:yes gene_type:complete
MSNKKITIFFLTSLSILFFFLIKNYSSININIEKILIEIFSHKDKNFFKFIVIIFLLNFIYFLSPLPVFPIILFNGFVFGNFGFVFSMFFICLGSMLIFVFCQNTVKKNISSLKIVKYISLKIEKYKFIKKTNNYIIFFSRFFIPYFLHNVIFSFYRVSLKRFIPIILVAEIPITLATNKIGNSLNNFVLVDDFIIYNLFFDYQFVLSLLLILFIILMAGIIRKFTINKFN